MESFELVDPDTVVMHLKEWNSQIPFSLNNLAGMMYSKKAFDEHGADWCLEHPAGTGPYVIKEIVKDSYTILVKDENYWNKANQPALYDEIEVRIYGDNMAAQAALLNGDCDVFNGGDYGMKDRIYQILCSCFILALQYGILERADMSRQMDAMRELIHQQRVQFETSKQNAQLINEKYHDLKKMLNDFRGRLSNEQIDALQHRIGGIAAVTRTGNEILDVLLMEKAVLCTQKEIQITCYTSESELDFVEDIDLYFLMNNLLTNAMEATEKLPVGERFITINVSRSGDMALVHMENSCEGPVEMENGLPKSQGDPRYHGFGMKSVARLVDKYDGSLAVKYLDHVFCVDMTLFRPASKAAS